MPNATTPLDVELSGLNDLDRLKPDAETSKAISDALDEARQARQEGVISRDELLADLAAPVSRDEVATESQSEEEGEEEIPAGAGFEQAGYIDPNALPEEYRQVAIERNNLLEASYSHQFVGETPAYKKTDANAVKMLDFLKSQGLPITTGSLRFAFRELSDAGQLELNESNAPAPQRQRNTVVSGLSERGGTPVEAPSEMEIDEAKFRSLSPQQRRNLLNRLHHEIRSGASVLD